MKIYKCNLHFLMAECEQRKGIINTTDDDVISFCKNELPDCKDCSYCKSIEIKD